jgi:cobalt/nickel transport system permease protein
MYLLAGSGWYTALKRTKRVLMTRAIPLISVFAAFSFVLMMFNLPLPGGTTGHAVGVAVAAIVLGPWGAILSISIALAIQALFFGDGGITTLGANCFNMAVVGSLVAYAVYWLAAGASPLRSRRRVFASAIAGYFAINAAALCAAVEFGIQPMLFHDASGAPLFAPYRLGVAIPAMMIGHLTLAGLAEAVISAGMVSYLQGANLGLLSGDVAHGTATAEPDAGAYAASMRRLWMVVAVLMVLTPLGILAAGTAWGEWAPAELAARHQASGNSVPAGLQRLSAAWTAPFPDYAPAFIRSASFGYMLSAMFGVGLLVALSLGAGALARRKKQAPPGGEDR